MTNSPIYLDNAATTPVLPEVWEAMGSAALMPGNAASNHVFGRRQRHQLENAREKIASLLDAQPSDVIFTSGATESNNLAIFSAVSAVGEEAKIVSSAIEHPSVREPIEACRKAGASVEFWPIDSGGGVVLAGSEERVKEASLACLMLANNETGVIQPVADVAKMAGEKTWIHCDAAAAVGKIPVSFRSLGATSLSVCAHKFHGPVGIGVLIAASKAKIRPRQLGGHQQKGRRPGTEPVALAVGMATALELAIRYFESRRAQVVELADEFLAVLQQKCVGFVRNGDPDRSLPQILNLSFPGLVADALLMALDLAGVACSTGSACSSGSLLPSPVIQAMGVPRPVLHSAMRFSFSPLISKDEVIDAGRRVAHAVQRLKSSVSEVSDESENGP